MGTVLELKKDLARKANPSRVKQLSSYFKNKSSNETWIGVTVPEIRKISKNYLDLNLNEISVLLGSKIHEEKLVSLLILVSKFQKSDEVERGKIYKFYIKNATRIDNWDLVDTSARDIVGAYLFDKDTSILSNLALSKNIWERRIAIISTYYYIQRNDFHETLKVAGILLQDSEDLIQKAVGWMLREIGKRNNSVLIGFLNAHSKKMPSIMLSHALERLPKSKKEFFRKGRKKKPSGKKPESRQSK